MRKLRDAPGGFGNLQPENSGSTEPSSAGRKGTTSSCRVGSPKIWYLRGFPIRGPWSLSGAGAELQLVRRQEHPSLLPPSGGICAEPGRKKQPRAPRNNGAITEVIKSRLQRKSCPANVNSGERGQRRLLLRLNFPGHSGMFLSREISPTLSGISFHPLGCGAGFLGYPIPG